MIYWNGCLFGCLELACINVSGLLDFHWPTFFCPIELKFDMLFIGYVLFRLEFLWNLWNCFDMDLIEIVLFGHLRLQIACLMLFCAWNDDGEWYEHGTNCICISLLFICLLTKGTKILSSNHVTCRWSNQTVKSAIEQWMVAILEEFGHHDLSSRVHMSGDIILNQDLKW